ncbi:MAG: hypothetical protein GYB68_17140 [Chloroflexi bacterium]|nr:hypothetical protein [Chloroflexota bacterium]
MRTRNKTLLIVVGALLVALILAGCNAQPATLEIGGVEVPSMDRGARWLATGIEELDAISGLSDAQQDSIRSHLVTLIEDPDLRHDESYHDQFMAQLEAEGYPPDALEVVERAYVRVSDPLIYHEGYWVAEIDSPNAPATVESVSDVHVDAYTGRITVYAQLRIRGNIIAPMQVGPGESGEHISGETVGFHPNAVYLNGRGQELDEADGNGSWWVKHSWIIDGEGYNNWEAGAIDYSTGGYYVTGTMLDELTMQMTTVFTEEDLILLDFPAELADIEDEFYGNLRTPILDTDPVTYEVVRFEPANLNPEAGPVDLTSTEGFRLISECRTEASPFDGLARNCPELID